MTRAGGPDDIPADGLFEDGEALVTLAQRAFEKAAYDALAESQRLGIATYGAVDGKLVVRAPAANARTSSKS